MDGRRLNKWLLSGCLAAGAMGCDRNILHSPTDGMPGAMPTTAVSNNSWKSFWSRGSQVPTDVTAEETAKGPPKPEFFATIADVQLASAFDEKTLETSRAELLDKARQGYQKS